MAAGVPAPGEPAWRLVTSPRRQQELLRSWSTWALTMILIDPAEVDRVRESGWAGTHHHDRETDLRVVGQADGLGFGVTESWHYPTELIAWSYVRAIAEAVPAHLREDLGAFLERWRDHQRNYPRFIPSAEGVGCDPILSGQPLTPGQEAYQRAREAFEGSGVLPSWEQRKAELEDERLQLHDRALPLHAGDPSAVDAAARRRRAGRRRGSGTGWREL